MKFSFVGTEAEIKRISPEGFELPGIQLRTFGETVELDEKSAENAIKGGLAIIPEADFKGLCDAVPALAEFRGLHQFFDVPEAVQEAVKNCWRIAAHEREKALIPLPTFEPVVPIATQPTEVTE